MDMLLFGAFFLAVKCCAMPNFYRALALVFVLMDIKCNEDANLWQSIMTYLIKTTNSVFRSLTGIVMLDRTT